MNIWELTVSMKIFISYINKKSQSADKMGWPVDINSFQYWCPLNWHAWNINRVPEWQRWRLSMTSPAWTSTSKANLITPTSEHPTSLTHWDFVFPIPASLCSAVFWLKEGALLPGDTAKLHWTMTYSYPQGTFVPREWQTRRGITFSAGTIDSNQQEELGQLLYNGDR